jgi:hypothetical protein
MIFKVLYAFEVETPSGVLGLKEGMTVKLSKEEAIPLIEEGKITPTGKVCYRIFSEILQEHLWIVDTDQDMHYLRAQGISGAVYTADEIRKLKGKGADFSREIQKVKAAFPESKIEEIKPREDKR